MTRTLNKRLLQKEMLPHKKRTQFRIKQLMGSEQTALTTLLQLDKLSQKQDQLNQVPQIVFTVQQMPKQEEIPIQSPQKTLDTDLQLKVKRFSQQLQLGMKQLSQQMPIQFNQYSQSPPQFINFSQWQPNKTSPNVYYGQLFPNINYIPTHVNYLPEIPKINIVTPEMLQAKETRIKLVRLMLENHNKMVRNIGNPISKTHVLPKPVNKVVETTFNKKKKTAKEHEKKLALNVINGCTKHRRQRCVNIECSNSMGF